MPPERDDDEEIRELRGVLHDVANALTVLLGWVSEARAPGASLESMAAALRITEVRARGAHDMARRVLGVAVPEDRQNDVLSSLVADTLGALAVEAHRAGVSLRAADGEAGGPVRVPAASDLSHVLTNLVLNAIAHAPRGSEVRVSVAEGDELRIEVADQGPGVAPGRSELIFQGDSTRDGGSGVGLMHARARARALGGDVALLAGPEAPAQGAVFRVTWPRALTSRSVPVPNVRSRALDGQRVLVVEDDRDVTALLETALSARGADVVVAHAARDIDAALAGGTFHAALLDVSPIAGRIEATLARLREQSPDVRIVFITGNADALPQDALESGRATWVRKPFEVGEVVAALTP